MNVLVVEDEIEYRDYLLNLIRDWDNDVRGAEDGEEARELLQTFTPDAMVTDLMMPRVDGVQLLKGLRDEGKLPPTIVMTAFGSLEKALEVVHELGGFWFVEKPVEPETLRLLLERAAVQRRLMVENEELRRQLSFQGVLGDMVGQSPQMREIFALIRQIAPTRAAVLVTGDSGTGKELVARAIHSHSPRTDQPFVALNCAAMPENLMESELFGHEKGSFTGAVERRLGAIEHAAGGTLFLDELAEMPILMQAKFLRVLEDFKFRRIGGKQELHADVRIVAATNRDPQKAIRDGKLREDLYYRLNVFEIHLPPLRDRKEDIPGIVDAMVQTLNRKHGTRVSGLSDFFLGKLMSHSWDGNVRELRNVIERAAILAGEGNLGEPHIPPSFRNAAAPVSCAATGDTSDPNKLFLQVGTSLEEAERTLIEATLQHAGNNKSRAASILGISTKTLYTKLKQYRLGAAEPEESTEAAIAG